MCEKPLALSMYVSTLCLAILSLGIEPCICVTLSPASSNTTLQSQMVHTKEGKLLRVPSQNSLHQTDEWNQLPAEYSTLMSSDYDAVPYRGISLLQGPTSPFMANMPHWDWEKDANNVKDNEPLDPYFAKQEAAKEPPCSFLNHWTEYAALFSLMAVSAWIGAWSFLQIIGGTAGKAVQSAPASGDQNRLYVLDNAKFFMIWIVIFIHIGQPRSQFQSSLVLFLNPFCTRIFCFLSGLVAREMPTSQTFKKVFFRQVMPLVFFCAFLKPLQVYSQGYFFYGLVPTGHFYKPMVYDSIFPTYVKPDGKIKLSHEWFLFTLIAWQLSRFVLAPFSPAWRLTIAVAVAAVGGYITYTNFALNLALVMLPCFVAGQLFPLTRVLSMVRWSQNTVALGFTLLGLILVVQYSSHGHQFLSQIPRYGWIDPVSTKYNHWLPMSHSPVDFCSPWEHALFWIRGLFRNILELSKGLIFIILICPRHKGPIADMGCRSLYPYLLQFFLVPHFFRAVRACDQEMIFAGFVVPEVWRIRLGWTAAFVFSLLTNVLLASHPVRAVCRFLLEPTWLEKFYDDARGHRPAKALHEAKQ